MKKKLLLLLLLTCLGTASTQAQQQPVAVSEYLSAGNIKAPVFADGPLFWDPYKLYNTPSFVPQWESPKNSGKGTVFAANLWIGGKDQQDQLYVAAETFRQQPSGPNKEQAFFYGPVAQAYNAAFDARYNKVWKVTAAQIEYHKLHYRQRNYAMPDGIATWPAHGDVTNGEAANLAPFADVNQNNMYDPLNGDYPVIRGAEALYFILNDARTNKLPYSPAMNIEIHGLAYTFDNPEDTATYNAVFLNYRIVNRSARNYKNVYAGIWTDFDIGFYNDDHIACDVQRNAFMAYNALPTDSSQANPNLGYGTTPPAQAVAFLGNTRLNSFVYYNHDNSPVNGVPTKAEDFYNYLRGIWKNNQPLTFGGNATDHTKAPYRYMFPGNTDLTGRGFSGPGSAPYNWTMNNLDGTGQKSIPTDVRGIGAFGPFNLNAGKEICFDVAFPFAQGRNNVHSAELVTRYIDQINKFFSRTYGNTCMQNLTATNPPNQQRHAFESFFPNPAQKEITLHFDQRLTDDVMVSVYDINGKKQSNKLLQKDGAAVQTINLENLKPGVYILNLVDGRTSEKIRVVVTE